MASQLSEARVQSLYQKFGDLKVLDDIIRHRAADDEQLPIVAYPRTPDSIADYEYFTGQQLDRYIDAACKYYLAHGFAPDTNQTVALLAPSDLDFIVSFFALSRLGYTILTLSLRIQPVAIINLLQKANCTTIVRGHSAQVAANILEVIQEFPIKSRTVALRPDYDLPKDETPRFTREFDRMEENSKIAVIIHSSGSTGLPKPIFLSHRALMTHPTQGSGYSNFNALPWYHLYGLSTCFQAMWMRRTAHLYNAALPLTATNLLKAVTSTTAEAIHAVPYAIGLLAEHPDGVKFMRSCKVVTSAGARMPDELGDRLVKEGVNIGSVFGTTEAGLLGDSMGRAAGDNTWNYIRIYSYHRQFIYMNECGPNQYECIYLKGHPALSTSDSDFPKPGSWHSKDVFEPHPTMSDVWKYVTRIDDRVTLVNGEKVLPLPIEGRLREDEFIREAVVCGVDKALPGLLVFRAEIADQISDEEYLEAIWPSVEDANSRAEAFSQITKEMIHIFPSNMEYPQTDKKNIIRAQCYKKFAAEIEAMYEKLDSTDGGFLKLTDASAIENFLMATIQEATGVTLRSVDTDFFSVGIDSLRSLELRRHIQKTLDLGGKKLPRNIVYEQGSVGRLAKYITALTSGSEVAGNDAVQLQESLIEKYSVFQPHVPVNTLGNGNKGSSVLLTGATGSIGSHVLVQLLQKPDIQTIYCLARGSDPTQRLLDSIAERGLTITAAQKDKIVGFGGDLSETSFGATPTLYAEMLQSVSLCIHVAWPVNFNISLNSFDAHLSGLHNLLQFSLSVPAARPAQVIFFSSVSTAFNTQTPALVPSGPITDLTQASTMGYGQSKLVGEHIVSHAVQAGARAYSLRIGQIVGDTKQGVWNDKEATPMMIRSALTLRALPKLDERCSWLPVDTLATTILQLAEKHETSAPASTVFNVLNPRPFHFSQLLRALARSKLPEFTTVSFPEWMELLKESAQRGEEVRNPAVKLLDYFEQEYGTGEGLMDGLEFDTSLTEEHAVALRTAPNVVEHGLVDAYVENWLARWTAA